MRLQTEQVIDIGSRETIYIGCETMSEDQGAREETRNTRLTRGQTQKRVERSSQPESIRKKRKRTQPPVERAKKALTASAHVAGALRSSFTIHFLLASRQLMNTVIDINSRTRIAVFNLIVDNQRALSSMPREN